MVHQLALLAPGAHQLRWQGRAAGGAAEQIHHQAGGVVAGIANHQRQGAAQLGVNLQEALLQPGFGGDQIHQLHHTRRVALTLTRPGGAAASRCFLGGIQQAAGIAHPGEGQALAQAGAAVEFQGPHQIGQDLSHGRIGAVERHRCWQPLRRD